MIFRKRRTPDPEAEASPVPLPPPEVLEVLDRLEKGGGQLTVRTRDGQSYTSAVVGLGRDAFYIDTLSPPDGDERVRPGATLAIETLFQGISYGLQTTVAGKVRFVDELPAFKLHYPERIDAQRRRKTPRVETRGDASLSFLKPFACDAPVVNVSEGGFAFEHGAELGRLRRGTVLREILLELGGHPVISIQGRVVGQLVRELGGIGLPSRYRVSVAFDGLRPEDRKVVQAYLAELRGQAEFRA
ncbi:MAG: flagellar brake protein [Deltaproteobacteria bacterium]|nr:flagellar brake protein [Deltaproteobacteria bacterium]